MTPVTPSRLIRAAALLLVLGPALSARAYVNPNPGPIQVLPPPIFIGPDAVIPVTLQPPDCAAQPPGKFTCLNNVWQKYCAAYWNSDDPSNPDNCAAQNATNLTTYGNQQSHRRGGADGGKVFDKTKNDFVPAWPTHHTGGLIKLKPASTSNSWAAHELKAKAAAQADPFIFDPLQYTRYPGVADGVPINSCEEYTYRAFWDVERWIDAVNACKNDDRCVTQVSMHGMGAKSPAQVPGIARRVPRDSDGQTITARMDKLEGAKSQLAQAEIDPFTDAYEIGGFVPKNAFYSGTTLFLTPSLIAGFAASGQDAAVQRLANELHRGTTLFDFGNFGPAPTSGGAPYKDAAGDWHEGFYDEWDFHSVMEKRTRPVSDGEAREYRRRADSVMQAWDLLADELKCAALGAHLVGAACGKPTPNALGKVHPGDTQMWQGDPLAARTIINNVDPTAWISPPSTTGMVGFGGQLQPGAYTAEQLAAGAISLGVQNLTSGSHLPGMVNLGGIQAHAAVQQHSHPAALMHAKCVGNNCPNITGEPAAYDTSDGVNILSLKGFLNQLWTVNPPRVDATVPYPHLNCAVSIRRGAAVGVGGGGIDFPPGNGLTGDPHYQTDRYWVDVCNFTNLLLEEWGRRLQGLPSCIDPTQNGCDWMPRDFVDRFVTKNVGYAAAAKEVEYKNCQRWTAGGKVKDPDTQHIGLTQGQRAFIGLANAEFNKREAIFDQKMKSIPVKAADDFGILRSDKQTIGDSSFGGGYSYDLGWHLKVMKRDGDGQICRLGGNAEAAFEAHATLFSSDFNVLDARATVSSNDNDDGKAWADGKLYVVGYQLFDTNGHYDLSQAYTYKKVDGGKPTLITAPFQVGWVTVTVSAGVAYDYGVVVTLTATAAQKTDCNAKAPIFEAKSTFTPFADLGGWVDADVSLAGIVGVGVEVDLTLVGIQLPLSASLTLGLDQQQLSILFQAGLDLVLTTLKGELDFYIEAFWTHVATFTIVKWDGFSHTFPVFRTPLVAIPLLELPKGSILSTNDSDPRVPL